MDADGNRRLVQPDVGRRMETHVGEFVCRVSTSPILAADDKVLEHGIAAEGLGGTLVAHLVYLGEFDPQKVQQLLGLFDRHARVVLKVRVHVLVEPHRRDRVAIRFNLDGQLNEPERLERLPERFSRLGRHFAADPGDLL